MTGEVNKMSRVIAEAIGYSYYQLFHKDKSIQWPGWKLYKEATPNSKSTYCKPNILPAYLCKNVGGMRFHLSYQWIMPVIALISREVFVDIKTGIGENKEISTAIFIHSDIGHEPIVFIHRTSELTPCLLMEAAYWYFN